MGISGEKYEFTQKNVDESPAQAGVYCFYEGPALIYFGRAEGATTIRAKLKSHFAGIEGECTENATHYRREAASNPAAREKELLAEFRQTHGRLPRCNAKASAD